MGWGGVPRPVADFYVAQPVDKYAAPVEAGADRPDTATAAAAELVKKRMPAAAFGTQHVRAHFSPVAVVGGKNLPLIQDRVTDQLVGVHGASLTGST